jgi:hypothetical protein
VFHSAFSQAPYQHCKAGYSSLADFKTNLSFTKSGSFLRKEQILNSGWIRKILQNGYLT